MKDKYGVKELLAVAGGLVLAVVVFAVALNVLRSQISFYIDLPSFFIVAGLGSAYALLCMGRKPSLLRFIKGFKTGALYAGGISCIATMITMLYSMAEDPDAIGGFIAISSLSLIYGLVLSAIARIVEKHLSKN